MTNRGKGSSNQRTWTKAEYFAHSRNKQADKWLAHTLQRINHDSFGKRMFFQQEMRELRESIRPLKCTTGYSNWSEKRVKSCDVTNPRKSVKFAADVRFGSLDTIVSRQLSPKNKPSLDKTNSHTATAPDKFKPEKSMLNLSETVLLEPSEISVADNRPLTTMTLNMPAKPSSSHVRCTQSVIATEVLPDSHLNDDLAETLHKNADDIATEGETLIDETKKDERNADENDSSEADDVDNYDLKTEEEIITNKAKQDIQKLPTVFEIQMLRNEQNKQAAAMRNARKLRRQGSFQSKGESESMGSSWSYDLSFESNSDDESHTDSQYLESELHTVPTLKKKPIKEPTENTATIDNEVVIENEDASENEENGEKEKSVHEMEKRVEETEIKSEAEAEEGSFKTERLEEISNHDVQNRSSLDQGKETSLDGINQQIMQVMSKEVKDEMEKLEQLGGEVDKVHSPYSQEGRLNPYSVNYASLSLSASTNNQSQRIIGRGALEKPKCLVEKEMALKIFDRTVTAALAKNKFRDAPERAKDDALVPGQGSAKVELSERRVKSATVPIARYVRAVEAGLETEHLVTSARNLKIPMSKARVKRERENLVQRLSPLRVNPEAEKQRMKEIEGKIRTFLINFPTCARDGWTN